MDGDSAAQDKHAGSPRSEQPASTAAELASPNRTALQLLGC